MPENYQKSADSCSVIFLIANRLWQAAHPCTRCAPGFLRPWEFRLFTVRPSATPRAPYLRFHLAYALGSVRKAAVRSKSSNRRSSNDSGTSNSAKTHSHHLHRRLGHGATLRNVARIPVQRHRVRLLSLSSPLPPTPPFGVSLF